MSYIGSPAAPTIATVSDDTITTAKLADDAVTSAKLDTNIAVDGNLTVDTDTLYVDSTNNRVGIGTSSPSNKLKIYDSAATSTTFKANTLLNVSSNGSGADATINLTDGVANNVVISQLSGQLLFGTGAGAPERMRIDSSGRVTMPYQPSFRVGDNCSIDGSGYFYNFTYTDFNVGSHYNNSTGKFTAPVSGLYYFFYSLYNGGSCTFEIRKNGSKIAYNDGSNGHPGVSALTLLSTNDYVQIYKAAGPNGNGNDFFIGCLLG